MHFGHMLFPHPVGYILVSLAATKSVLVNPSKAFWQLAMQAGVAEHPSCGLNDTIAFAMIDGVTCRNNKFLDMGASLKDRLTDDQHASANGDRS